MPIARSRRVCRQPQSHDLTSTVPQDQEPIQQSEGKRRHDEQVHGGDTVSTIAKKGPPALRRPCPPLGHVLCNACLADIDAELEQFAVDAGCVEAVEDDPSHFAPFRSRPIEDGTVPQNGPPIFLKSPAPGWPTEGQPGTRRR